MKVEGQTRETAVRSWGRRYPSFGQAGCLAVASLAMVMLLGCGRGDLPHTESPQQLEMARLVKSVPLTEATEGETDAPLFSLLPEERTGVDFVHAYKPTGNHIHQFDSYSTGSGVTMGDYDNDGQVDVFLTRQIDGGRLYRNLGDFRFRDVTAETGLDDALGSMWSTGASFVDIDNDADLDLYVCGFDSANRLYINRGDGTFTEKAAAFGLDFHGASTQMAFADYDADGDLDAYLLTNRMPPDQDYTIRPEHVAGEPQIPKRFLELHDFLKEPAGTYLIIDAGQYDHLYQNNGDGTFTDVSQKAGITGNYYGLSATWWDYNHDGCPDLYVANDFWGPDQLFHNNGNGTFTDVASDVLPHVPWYSMGADVADINNDGRLDFMASDMAGTNHYRSKIGMGDMSEFGWFLESSNPRQYMRNAVYLNSGVGRFMEVAHLCGLSSTDWTWSIKFADLDNDGWTDLFVTNGMTRDWFNSDLMMEDRATKKDDGISFEFWGDKPIKADTNRAFRNLGNLNFQDVGKRWGLDHVGLTYGAAIGDLDGDGDLDLVVNNFEESAGFYRNNTTGRHSVRFRLRGTLSNQFGVGTVVRLKNAAGVQVRYLTLSRGFMSADEPVVHFGLGDHDTIDRIEIEWPSGQVQTLENLVADRQYTVTEPEKRGASLGRTDKKYDLSGPSQSPPTMFSRAERVPTVSHDERPYDDYARQPLLPYKLSQLGPGVAVGDVDGDSDEDLVVGGPAGLPTRIFLNDAGRFEYVSIIPFQDDRTCEDMGLVLFDVDGDGDLDLYVVSGGVECEPDAEVLQDRLYMNNGKGAFTKASGDVLPALRDSGSVVTSADFDRDGDLDLFVGGRVIPGQYPLTPNSHLLENNDGKFIDVTDRLAAGLSETGLVTSAVWSDADGDGWVDLLVAHEWGPIKLFRNQQGTFVDATAKAHLADRLGWWNCIAAGDLDNDGDMDYVATNFGLNTKYHATSDTPTLLYYGDFENSGRMRLVEAEFEDEKLFPVRGRSCSTNAMPFVGEKFETFHAFALSELVDIYTATCLDSAHRFAANTLESGVFINDGKGQFAFEPLPRLAQISPGFGVALTDVDADGNTDVYLLQNFFSPQPETGRMHGGVSLLLLGSGADKGTRFTSVWPEDSGLIVPGDAKGLAVTDVDGNAAPDFVVTNNNDKLAIFENHITSNNQRLAVVLRGKPGNPTAVGARITVLFRSGLTQTVEVQAGGGYLSQSTSQQTFGSAKGDGVTAVTVRWPDGQETTVDHSKATGHVVIEQPQ